MARVFIDTSAWRRLMELDATADARTLFVLLCSSPTVNHGGLDALTPQRWAELAGITVDRIETGIDELVELGLIVVDRATQEVWTPSVWQWNAGLSRSATIKPHLSDALSADIRRTALGR